MPIARNKPTVYLGIDPGASGGIAILNGADLLTVKIPETDKEILTLFQGVVPTPAFAVLEKVGGFVKGNPAPGSAMFNFGLGFGLLRMALTAAEIPFEEVTPQKWQKGIGITGSKSKLGNTAWKNILYQKAQQLFPSAKFPKYVADAVLIAEYCRRKKEGKL